MKLVIVESPAKAKTIERYLGAGYKVLSSVGHIRDIPKTDNKKNRAIDIEAGFVLNYQILPEKKKVIEELKKNSQKADEVILAADYDREGEAIAWHLKEVLNLKEGEYSRIVFTEITKEAILEALKNKRDIDLNLKKSQEARRALDRIFGYGLSNLIWTKLWYGLSAGRVQSPALRILVEREREIKAFKAEKFWRIKISLKNDKGILLTAKYPKDVFDLKLKEKIKKTCLDKKIFEIKEIQQREVAKKPNAPFTTSTLQQSANSYLGFAPSKTMSVAQKLYEKGYITYMRTDSSFLSKKSLSEISFFIRDNLGKEYLENREYKKKSKNAQEAHEAIRPTDISKSFLGDNEDEKRLYNLIWKRTLASQMSSAKFLRTSISLSNSEQIDNFKLSGSQIIFDGWYKIFPEAKGEEQILPELTKGEKFNLLKFEAEEKETTPPNRYSEAGLVKEMESRGIGRPSTYASTIKTLKDRKYVINEGRTLIPTEIGMVVSTFLEEHFPKYISDEFTAEMEDELDLLAEGKEDYVKLLSDFYEKFTNQIKSKKDIEKISNLGKVEGFECPKCNSEMLWKLSRNGRFMSCSKYPDCDGARTEEGKVLEGPKDLGKDCPKCGLNSEKYLEAKRKEEERYQKWLKRKEKAEEKGKEVPEFKAKEIKAGRLVLREGRFGKFISCSEYPKCKYIEEDEETKRENSTGVVCNLCQKGEMTKRMGRFGEFYSCSEYPDCKNIIKARPTGKKCHLCGSLMMEGTKTIPERCSKKECPMNRPDRMKK